MSKDVPESHPRYLSLMTRERIACGVEKGITSEHGLIAQGRGEAFDYLIGEKTHLFAQKSIDAALALLLLAEHPVISVNGNVAALSPKEIVALSRAISAKIEVNIFHTSKEREQKIQQELLDSGAEEVLLPSESATISDIDHNRRFVNEEGILKADVVFVPLEDGDRCEALVAGGKKVVTVDLNPLSRTAQTATITIVDNIVRVIPFMIERVEKLRSMQGSSLRKIVSDYDNSSLLKEALAQMQKTLSEEN